MGGNITAEQLTTSPSRSPPPVFEGIGRSPVQHVLSARVAWQGNEAAHTFYGKDDSIW